MNIQIKRDATMPTDLTGGEFGVSTLKIYVDPALPIRTQRILVIHSIIENYNRGIPHDKVEELCEFIEGGLDMLEEIETATHR